MTNETEIDLQGINGDGAAAATGIEFGKELMTFAEALAGGDSESLAMARDQLLSSAGASVLVDASGVAANFQRMVRIADSIGIPVDNMESELGQGIRNELESPAFPAPKIPSPDF